MSQATHTYEEWQQIGASVDYRDSAFVDGELVQARSGKTYECINPTTGERLAEVAECGTEDVDRAVQAARKSFEGGGWSEAAPADRKAVMLRLAELIRENADELAVMETMDMGKPVEDAAQVDIPGAAGLFQWYAEAADKLYGEVAPTGMDDVALVTREPVGVMAAVTPVRGSEHSSRFCTDSTAGARDDGDLPGKKARRADAPHRRPRHAPSVVGGVGQRAQH